MKLDSRVGCIHPPLLNPTHAMRRFLVATLFLCLGLLLPTATQAQFNFVASNLQGESTSNPTSLQFGPDGRLYVAQQDGLIKRSRRVISILDWTKLAKTADFHPRYLHLQRAGGGALEEKVSPPGFSQAAG